MLKPPLPGPYHYSISKYDWIYPFLKLSLASYIQCC